MISPHASNLPQMRRVNQQLTATKLKQLHTKPTLLAIALTSGILCASTALAQTDIKPDYRVSASGLPWFNYNPSMIDPKPEQFPLGIVFKGREAAKKPFATMLTNTHLLNVFMLKFKDGLAVKYDGKQFVLNEKKLPNADLRRGTAKLNDNAKRESSRQIETLFLGVPGVSIIPLVNKPQAEHDAEMSRLDDYSPVPLADMATYFTITLPEKSSRETTMRLINALNANDAVELAEPISIMTTPSVKAKTSPRQQSLVLSSTPDFSYLQTYLQSAAAPDRTGIGATYAWTFPGGKGEGTRFLDVEFDWNIAHEDLKAPFPSFGMLGLLPPSLTPRETRYHGTAAVGMLVSKHNGFGVNGIIPEADWGYVEVLRSFTQPGSGTPSLLSTLYNAADMGLREGDAILVEQQTQVGGTLAPVEAMQTVYDAIQFATALGVIVVEPAANGLAASNIGQPIDGLIAGPISGAVMVGARDQLRASPSYFTNFGTRVDLFGQGDNVVSTGAARTPGYGTGSYCNSGGVPNFAPNEFIYPPPTFAGTAAAEDICYTQTFGGTSSASPIVTGALLSLQGIHRAAFALGNSAAIPNYIRPQPLLNIFKKTGYPQTFASTTKPIGKGPDLQAAITHYFADFDSDSHSNGKEAAMGWARTYRLYNMSAQRHFWTQDENERNVLMSSPSWSCEGLAYKLFNTREAYNGYGWAGLGTALYRLLNPSTVKHLLTSSEAEKTLLLSYGWQYEGVMGYVAPSPAPNLVPLYRIYFSASQYHFVTTDLGERNYWINVGAAVNDGIIGYVVPVNPGTNGPAQCNF